MKYSNKNLSQTITQLCLAKEIVNIVISPGSRNAPLTISFTENPGFKNYSVVDERSAAFFALGLAQQLKKPVVLVCSSGSALLNYYPAIAEAFYSDIPLVVLSADRPDYLINIGDGQTIMQENIFGNHILENANCIEGEDYQDFNEEIINSALNKSIEFQGPVHINIPFEEPLYEVVSEATIHPKNNPPKSIDNSISEDLSGFLKEWNSAKNKMLLVGVMQPNSIEQQFLDQLAEDESVIVLTETTSNLHHDNFFPHIDQLIAPLTQKEFDNLQPEILLTFGGMIVSKKIKAFLRKHSPKQHWHVATKKAFDTYFCLNHHFKIAPNQFLKEFLPKTEVVKSTFQQEWLKVKNYRIEKHQEYVNQIPYSDFKVFSEIIETLPNQIQLQLSNSTTIRYAQLFEIDKSIQMFCNRGTSGIDGCTSTAIGAAVVSEKPTTFITGDLSFLYDSNALWNNYIPNNFKIIIINNEGGGIFRILPGEKDSDNFSTYFETKHHLTAAHLATMYGFEYHSIVEEIELKDKLKSFFSTSEKPKILEIFTPSEVNDKVLLAYFKHIKC